VSLIFKAAHARRSSADRVRATRFGSWPGWPGCPSAALLDEIGRAQPATKHAFTGGLLAYIDDIAARLAPDDPQSARAHVLSVFAMMAGTVQLARALADPQLADDVLEQGTRNALALFGAAHHS
jgi:TetR/AcrR family transcriptional repressor of nem operon